ncbi:hypothetical protein RHGRI_027711 [Rhododendron griersonianum]|uniref:Uncharacterized protein n=1 Tax=Rhododendron griersonianum TaxID=479676 RepID=A0AAV6IXS4_9ERIC|nr:hypothetical protein RHGRI_027711 [Rhododendron griersonianum]
MVSQNRRNEAIDYLQSLIRKLFRSRGEKSFPPILQIQISVLLLPQNHQSTGVKCNEVKPFNLEDEDDFHPFS